VCTRPHAKPRVHATSMGAQMRLMCRSRVRKTWTCIYCAPSILHSPVPKYVIRALTMKVSNADHGPSFRPSQDTDLQEAAAAAAAAAVASPSTGSRPVPHSSQTPGPLPTPDQLPAPGARRRPTPSKVQTNRCFQAPHSSPTPYPNAASPAPPAMMPTKTTLQTAHLPRSPGPPTPPFLTQRLAAKPKTSGSVMGARTLGQ